ncbi:helix-turn-helix transcriptional regulator [Reichenbachiella ulvae]|uniref:AraC family transcriptional regulator n=1 Tax=Reichenbachiella ulvae TaxID=2980104 RepID=A0ABT3CUE4_9BACT|nr:AraC family transcriptional regulator [Reichenbachiella ulvae]MCV9387311.1 AraC family transcriptional regulator [Reichenbachiella ulvae]
MINLHSFLKDGPYIRKLKVSEMLFAEYTCLREETRFGVWSDNNYFAFVTSGKKMWRTIHNDYDANKGDILFIKKGANLVHQFFDDEFCAIFLFIPDEFIQAFLKKYSTFLEAHQPDLSSQDAVLRLHTNELLTNYCQSIQTYLSLDQAPNEDLLKLKFEELLLSLFSDKQNQDLKSYFVSLCQDELYHLTRVMEENYAYNLKLEDYAKLCHMSLSKFKQIFKAHYKDTPAAWLKARKLELAHQKLLHGEMPINQLSLECGFEDPSHFIRVFKQKYEVPPLQYRQSLLDQAS